MRDGHGTECLWGMGSDLRSYRRESRDLALSS